MKNYFELPDELKLIDEDWELITPNKAEQYLETMRRNRSLRQHTTNKYKNDFLSGKFEICYDSPIIFNRNGEMVNGQHRCQAVLQSGKSFWCKVYRNVPNDAIIDKGITRSVPDSLWMRKIIPDNLKKASYTSIVNAYLNIKIPQLKKDLPENEIGQFLNKWSEQIVEAYRISNIGSTRPIGDKAGLQAALFAALVCGVSKDTLTRMMKIVNTGFYDGDSETAAIVLRKQIVDDFKGGGVWINWLEGVTERAIVDFVSNRPRRQKYKGSQHLFIQECPANIEQEVEQ